MLWIHLAITDFVYNKRVKRDFAWETVPSPFTSMKSINCHTTSVQFHFGMEEGKVEHESDAKYCIGLLTKKPKIPSNGKQELYIHFVICNSPNPIQYFVCIRI